ncbi:hypothetical protein Q9S_00835 [Enterococcus faecalis EnGen0080]|nr:hypothetical protein Q9S_00835 [Enterococcus faecalis EnGen0080]ETU23309.1 hypothetical protein P011_01975 [Enterococcus faecalis EnGen0411]RBR58294.1 hypothetical protein EB37_02026 [Enterococcus faecalis]CAC9739790.1 hypothetical protein IE105CO2MC_01744 [Enterococcus faecalis]CAC9740541.1 hypothetical protein IE105AEPC_01660 [Enterococcus faecalis]
MKIYVVKFGNQFYRSDERYWPFAVKVEEE